MGVGLAAAPWIKAWAELPAEFGPERFDLGHLLVRDGERIEAPKPERHCEVVIVGSGIAGLTAGYLLRNRDLLLLDKEPATGGHARAGEWEGIRYSLAAAYLTEPYPPLIGFYRDTGILDGLRRIADPVDCYFSDGRFGPLFRGPDFERLERALIKIAQRRGAPTIPVEQSGSWALAFDHQSLERYLIENGYGAEVREYVALYCRSAFSALPSEISAFAGLNFLMGELAPRYSFPGGTAGAAERLTARIEAAGAGRIQLNATVAAIHPSHPDAKGGALVVYADSGGEALHSVSGQRVIVATNKLAASRMVRGLPADQKAAIALAHRGAAVVANVCLKEAAPAPAYDSWYSGGTGTDVISADWVRQGGPARGTGRQVLTFYCNTLRDHVSLLGRSAEQWSERVLGDLERLRPGASRQVAAVRLSRFGHALICPPPGYITGPRNLTRRPLGPILFAHSDGQGLPAFEAAIWEGMAAARALAATKRHGAHPVPAQPR